MIRSYLEYLEFVSEDGSLHFFALLVAYMLAFGHIATLWGAFLSPDIDITWQITVWPLPAYIIHALAFAAWRWENDHRH